MNATEVQPQQSHGWRAEDEQLESRCAIKPEFIRPVLRALGKHLPKADVCPRQRAKMNELLNEFGLPPYQSLVGYGVFKQPE